LDALVVDELAEVDDCGALAGEEALEPVGIALVGESLVRVAGIRRVVSRLLEQRGQRLAAALGTPKLDVDSGWHLVNPIDGPAHLSECFTDVLRPHDHGGCAFERLSAPR
jgi:hypothetical protein